MPLKNHIPMNPKFKVILVLLKNAFSFVLFAGALPRRLRLFVMGLAVLAVPLAGFYFYHRGVTPLPTAPRPVPQTLEAAIIKVCQDIPAQLPAPERALRPTLLLPLASDREGLITGQLRSALDQQGWYRPVDTNLRDMILDTARELTGIGADPAVRSMQWTPSELSRMMRSAKAETVLRGTVDRFSLPTTGDVAIKLRLELWEQSEPDAVLIHSFVLEHPQPVAPDAPKATSRHWFGAYSLAVLVALICPLAMIPWMRRAIREDSNEAILKVLLGITAILLLAFILFLIWRGTGVFGIIWQGGIAAVFLFLYTAFILNFVYNKTR